MELNPGEIVGRWRIEGALGQGAAGTVYAALDIETDEAVAIRVLHARRDAVRKRLERDAPALAALSHPNVARFVAGIDVRGAPALVYELVEGPPLAALLAERKLELEEVDTLARGIVEGMAAAHAAGHVHLHLEPKDVVLAGEPWAWVPRLLDVGLTPILTDEAGTLVARAEAGTPAYRAPEQIRGEKAIDARADVFALGAVLYEMVTGQRAFPQADASDVVQSVLAGRFQPPRELCEWVPERMVSAIAGALRPDPDRRIPDCPTLLKVWCGEMDLETATLRAPAEEPPPPPSPPMPKAMLAAGVILVSAIVFGGAFVATRPPAEPAAVAPAAAAAPARPESAPRAASSAVAVPAEAVPADDAAPAAPPPPVGSARVEVTGDARRVWLESDAGKVEPGVVPAGTYRVRAVFRGEDAVDAGAVTLADGETATLLCATAYQVCKRR